MSARHVLVGRLRQTLRPATLALASECYATEVQCAPGGDIGRGALLVVGLSCSGRASEWPDADAVANAVKSAELWRRLGLTVSLNAASPQAFCLTLKPSADHSLLLRPLAASTSCIKSIRISLVLSRPSKPPSETTEATLFDDIETPPQAPTTPTPSADAAALPTALISSALLAFIHGAPARSGPLVRTTSAELPTSLARLAPLLFSPGYTKALAHRARLIPSLSRSLALVQASATPALALAFSRFGRAPCDVRAGLEAALFRVARTGLFDAKAARRLPALGTVEAGEMLDLDCSPAGAGGKGGGVSGGGEAGGEECLLDGWDAGCDEDLLAEDEGGHGLRSLLDGHCEEALQLGADGELGDEAWLGSDL